MRKLSSLSVAVLVGLMGCGSDDEGGLPANTADAIRTYGEVVHASYLESHQEAVAMDQAIDAMIAGPSAATLQSAKDAWLSARVPYLQTEVFRFYDGPIDGMDGEPEGQINAWPMDEQLVDYVDGDTDAGLVNDTDFALNADAILGENGRGGDKGVATGWHPIEFLLWGQDLDDPSAMTAGQRSFEDYTTGANADRRGQYLGIISDQLVADLDELVQAWAPGQSNYRAELEAATQADALQRILTGMIVLSGFETAGERLQAALDAHDQEEEHSCFSDNTHNDMLYDVIGVRNVWLGQFGSVNGTGIKAVVEAADADLAARLDAKINESVSLAMALQPPFDLEIASGNADGNARVQALIDSLRDQEMLLQEVFQHFGFTVPNPE